MFYLTLSELHKTDLINTIYHTVVVFIDVEYFSIWFLQVLGFKVLKLNLSKD